MKEIPLTQGQVALVDDDDYERLARFKWQAEWSRNAQTWYAKRRTPKAEGKKTVRMHREVMGAAAGEHVDHRNHNGLDNRRENLRRCSPTQNNANRRNTEHTSKFKGVSWHALSGKWKAQISIDNRNKYLGTFASEEDAARVYDKVARELWGEFARTNGSP